MRSLLALMVIDILFMFILCWVAKKYITEMDKMILGVENLPLLAAAAARVDIENDGVVQ